MKKLLFCTLPVLALAVTATAADTASPFGLVKGTPVKITACVADADADDYVLTHVQTLSPAIPAGGNVLATGTPPRGDGPMYWLSKNSIKRMKEHVGHKVEVTGTITDVSMGTVHVKKEPGKSGPDNKIEIEARGKEATGKTDRPVGTGPDAVPGMKVDEKKSVPFHRIDVDTVKMLGSTCP